MTLGTCTLQTSPQTTNMSCHVSNHIYLVRSVISTFLLCNDRLALHQSTPVMYDTMTTIQESHLTTCNSCIKQLAMTSGDKGEHCNLQSRYYLLAIFFLFCGVLLSSLNQSSAPQHVEGPLPRPAWIADLYSVSLASSRVVLPGDPDYSQVVQVSPGAGAGAPPGQVSPL